MSEPLPGDENFVPPVPDPWTVENVYLVGSLGRNDSGGYYATFSFPGNVPTDLETAKVVRDQMNTQDAMSAGTETSDFYKVFEVASIREFRE